MIVKKNCSTGEMLLDLNGPCTQLPLSSSATFPEVRPSGVSCRYHFRKKCNLCKHNWTLQILYLHFTMASFFQDTYQSYVFSWPAFFRTLTNHIFLVFLAHRYDWRVVETKTYIITLFLLMEYMLDVGIQNLTLFKSWVFEIRGPIKSRQNTIIFHLVLMGKK